MTIPRSALVACLLLAAACGGSQPEAAAPAAPAPSASAAPAPSAAPAASAAPTPSPEASAAASAAPPPPPPPVQKTWKDLSHDERLALMKEKVMPAMKEEFQKADAKDFADFTCKTCHGPGVKQGKFDMPNPLLPKLHLANGLKDEEKKHPAMTKFMAEVVTPKMTEILGEQKFDMATHTGFGCGSCHTMAK